MNLDDPPNWWKVLLGGADGILDGAALRKSAVGVWIRKKSGAFGFSLTAEPEEAGVIGGGLVRGGRVDWLKLLLTLFASGM